MPLGDQKTIAILAYQDLPAIHDFLVDAFQLRPGGVEHDSSGQAVHAEVYASDGSVIWLHRHAPEHGLASPAETNMATGGVVVIVDDVDAHWRHAQSKGRRSTIRRWTRTTASASTAPATPRAAAGIS